MNKIEVVFIEIVGESEIFIFIDIWLNVVNFFSIVYFIGKKGN